MCVYMCIYIYICAHSLQKNATQLPCKAAADTPCQRAVLENVHIYVVTYV